MSERKRIYLSSTFEDLKHYRAAVSLALERAGFEVARMEAYVASDERPMDLCLDDVARADIYVGLVAWHYGYVPPVEHGNSSGKSITDLEYERARACEKRTLLFLAAPETLKWWPKPFVDPETIPDDGDACIEALRERLSSEHTVSFFSSPDDLATLVLTALMRPGLGERPYMVPALPPETVVRSTLVRSLVEAVATPGRHVLVHGAAGFGKTRLVVTACHDPTMDGRFDAGMLWVTLGQQPDVLILLRDLYACVVGTEPEVAGQEALTQALGRALSKTIDRRRFLLVVDDVWREDDLGPFLELTSCTLIVTSRRHDLLAGATRLSVEEMTVDEAAALLGRDIGVHSEIEKELHAMAERLGCWPLLLGLVNARLIQETREQKSARKALSYIHAVYERRGVLGFDRHESDARDRAVARSVAESLDFLDHQHPGISVRAIEISLFPEDVVIPVRVLADLWRLDPFDASEDVVRPLHDNALLLWDRNSDTVTVHDMLRAVLHERLRDEPAVHARLIATWGEPLALPHDYAWRWYGWHCVKAGLASRLNELLGNFWWLRGKMKTVGIDALCAEYRRADFPEFTRRVGAALLLSADVLARDADQLAPHLIARIAPEGGGESDEQANAFVRAIHAAMAGQNWLRPVCGSLVAPGGSLERTIDPRHEKWFGIESMQTSLDGTCLVTTSQNLFTSDTVITVWDIEKVCVRQQHRLGPSVVTRVSIDAAARFAIFGRDRHKQPLTPFWRERAEASSDASLPQHTVEVLDLETGAVVHSFGAHTARIVAVAHAQIARLAASASRDGSLILWDLATGSARWQVGTGVLDITHLVFTPNGSLVVGTAGASDRCVRLWQAVDGQLMGVLGPFPSGLRVAAVAPDGEHLAVASDDRVLHIWSLSQRKQLATLQGHEDDIHAVAFTPDSQKLLSASGELVYSPDNTVRVWDVMTRTQTLVFRGHGHSVTAVASLPDGQRVLSASRDDKIRVWRLDAAVGRAASLRHDEDVNTFAMTPCGRSLLSGGADGRLKVWDPDTGALLRSIDVSANRSGVQHVVVLPNGLQALSIASSGYGRGSPVQLSIWDIRSGHFVRHVGELESGWIDALCVAPDGQYAVTLQRTGELMLWDLAQGGVLRQSPPHTAASRKIHYAMGGAAVLFGSPDGAVKLWWVSRDEVTDVHCAHAREITTVSLSPSERFFVSTDANGLLVVWDSHDCVKASETMVDPYVSEIAFSADDSVMVAVSGTGTLRIWRTSDWSLIHSLRAHGSAIYSVAISPDSDYVATASVDESIRVWAVNTGQQLGWFRTEGGANACAVGTDGRTFMVGDRAGGVHFLRLELESSVIPS